MITRRIALPLALVFLPILLSVWPALRPAPGTIAVLEPGVALDTLTLIAVAIYTFLTYELVRHTESASARELTRRRNAVATALLAELVVLEEKLIELTAEPVSEYSSSMDFRVLSNAVANVDLFDSDAAYLLVRLHSQVVRLSETAVKHWILASQSGAAVSLGNRDCNRAVFALNILHDLVSALRPIAPEFERPWKVFDRDDAVRLRAPTSVFSDVTEEEYPRVEGSEGASVT